MSSQPESPRLAEVARRVSAGVEVLERLSGERVVHVTTTEDVDDGYQFYREEDGQLFYRACERGRLTFEQRADTVDELARMVLADHARQLATQAVRSRRGDSWPGDSRPGDSRPGDWRRGDWRRGDWRRGDSRRWWFALTEEWLSVLDPRWGELERQRHAEILQEHPFRA